MKTETFGRFLCMLVTFIVITSLSLVGRKVFNLSDDAVLSRPRRSVPDDDYGTGTENTTDSTEEDRFQRECIPPSITQFPGGLFTMKQIENGAITIHIIVALYMFLALALICDDYFVPALEVLCKRLELRPDVAGATFMAAGSSAPELFTSIVAVFITGGDIGVGTIVGSAVFNVLFIISLCGLFSGMVIQLSWYPLMRDCLCYFISIATLVVVIFDGVIHFYEALLLIGMYVLYIVLMKFNHLVENWCFVMAVQHCPTSCLPTVHNEDIPLVQKIPREPTSVIDDVTYDSDTSINGKENGVPLIPDNIEKLEEEEEPKNPLQIPEGFLKRLLWAVSLPIILLLFITIPDCRRFRWRRYYILTFFMSILWIAIFSYFLVWMVTMIGYLMRVPDTIMGLTFLAAGTSVPDAMSSVLVARDGYGDMAVSNSIGSNIFDLLICLGLPWFFQTFFVDFNSVVNINSAGLAYTSLTLLTTVGLLVSCIAINRWCLDKKLAFFLIVLYILFLIFASLQELNIFGYVNPPLCPMTLQ